MQREQKQYKQKKPMQQQQQKHTKKQAYYTQASSTKPIMTSVNDGYVDWQLRPLLYLSPSCQNQD